jgi:hypothetical protein
MPEFIKVDVTNPDLFKPPEFRVLKPGLHTFVVAKIGKFEPAQKGSNLVCKAEFRCQDDGDEKGLVVFENFVLIQDTSGEKAKTARRLNQQRMVQLCLACGVTTKDQVAATSEIPLLSCENQFFKAESNVQTKKYMGEEQTRAKIRKYVFAE